MKQEENTPPVLVICGVKNSGKTTLTEKIVEKLSGKGRNIAVIKHDGHDFTCDVPGTDSARFYQAGAYGTAVFSDYRLFIHKEKKKVREQELLEQFPEAELILIEGLKNSTWPKIEVVRKEISSVPVSNPKGRFLIVSDCPEACFDETVLGFDEMDAIIETIEKELLL